MQRVVVLFVGLLSVVRATSFDPDSVDLPTPFSYIFKLEKCEFGNDLFPENSENEEEIGTFISGENSNRIYSSGEGKKDLKSLFGDLQECDIITMKRPPKEGCVYVANGDIYFIEVLYEVDIEDVYLAFEEAGIGKCKEGKDEFNNALEGGCFRINEAKQAVYWIGVYDGNILYESDKVDDIKGLFGNVEKCNISLTNMPQEGCSLFDEDSIHYLNVLNYDKIDDVEKSLNELNIPKCVYNVKLGLITKEPCYLINPYHQTIHFLNLPSNLKVVLDDDNDDDHYSEETYDIPDAEVSPPSLVQPATGSGNLHQLTLKGLFNQQPVDAKKAKAVLLKKIQSRKLLQEVEKKLGRQGR